MLRWLSLLVLVSGCATSSTWPSLTLLEDDCGDSPEEFTATMAKRVSFVWQANDARGVVKYLEHGEYNEDGIAVGYWIELGPYPGGYVGRAIAVKLLKDSDVSCSIAYAVLP